MKKLILLNFLVSCLFGKAQISVTIDRSVKSSGVHVAIEKDSLLQVKWQGSDNDQGQLVINLQQNASLFKSIQLIKGKVVHEIAKDVDPLFWLTIGKRDLVSQNGWNIFFDKVPRKPHQSFKVAIHKKEAVISSYGTRTVIKIGEITAAVFKGAIEITLYNGSSMFNVAAVMTTEQDSTAIVYDAGLVSKHQLWDAISYADVYDKMQTLPVSFADTVKQQNVKYRTIIGNNSNGSLAVFPAPHQYFYPLDEAFNLKFTWFGSNYQQTFEGYGIGIRQDLYGDRRFVPWFNAPPGTAQRLNFFCQLSATGSATALAAVKQLTRNDHYAALPGYKTMSSHFHNEFVVNVIMANKPLLDTPSFVQVFKTTGIDMVHLGEFHYTAHPKGPDELRLLEMKYMFDMCKKYSDKDFLLMPGEEPNEFFGGHWLQLFPKPVYWIMSRKEGMPMEWTHPVYGKVYSIDNASEMLELLEKERGLAWTAHARTKGSTGYPDKYKTESFFQSDRFLGAAWKAMPADLSQPKLGNGRILDLMDDMNNWGQRKKIIAEADLFTVEPENEMYAHLNVNYLQMDKLPAYEEGWQSVLDALEAGRFFTTTGEVLIPSFTVNGQGYGKDVQLVYPPKTNISFTIQWTFPLNFAEIITGDGERTFRHTIDLKDTKAYGKKDIQHTLDLTSKKWIRLEVWDVAANGAFTQTIWLK